MNINNYDELIDYLYMVKDEKYKKFHQKLLKNDNIKLIGVRTPILKKISKSLVFNYKYYIDNNKHSTYEETIIHGIMLGYINIEFQDLLNELDKFIQYIDNWATCDITVSNLKIFKKNKEQGFKYIKKCILDNNVWKQRFGVVLLNSYYIDDQYIESVIDLLININTDEYYLEMAIAWALSTCFIRYSYKIINILKEKKLSINIHNITIQKILDSTRIDRTLKEQLKQLKIDNLKRLK